MYVYCTARLVNVREISETMQVMAREMMKVRSSNCSNSSNSNVVVISVVADLRL